MDTNRFARVLRIMLALQSGRAYSISDLARITGVTRRTVFRDLEELQKAGIPCHYRGKQQQYAIDQSFCLPTSKLTPKEALGLILLTQKIRQHVQHPLSDSVLNAALKIESTLSDDIKDFCSKALSAVTVKPAPQWDALALDKIFMQLLQSILTQHVVNLEYYFSDKRYTDKIELSPYHLIYNDNGWYVLGRTENFSGVKSFNLSHIKHISITEKRFVQDADFDVQEYLGRAWSMKREGRLHQVKLKFLPDVAQSVAKIDWHSTQTVEFLEDGSAIIRFRVDGLTEIVWWILSYGDRVQVLAPKALREKVIEIAKKTISANEET